MIEVFTHTLPRRPRWSLVVAAAMAVVFSACAAEPQDTGDLFALAQPVNSCTDQEDGLPCSDDNVCTVDDVCAAGVCVGEPITYAAACDDGNPCTTRDTCAGWLCMGAQIPDDSACDDGDPCTVGDSCHMSNCVGDSKDCSAGDEECKRGVCDPQDGECKPENLDDGAPCNDGDLCTLADVCEGGVCDGAAQDCGAAGDDCNAGVCDPSTGACIPQPLADGLTCDDGDHCTQLDECAAGECVGLDPVDCDIECYQNTCDPATGACIGAPLLADAGCDDGNPCTQTDVCDGLGGCAGVALEDGAACSDGDACTGLDRCENGVCVFVTELCQCDGQDDEVGCTDYDPCTVDDQCVSQSCIGVAKDCTGLDDDCNYGQCNADTGECSALPRLGGTGCDDGDPCTVADNCNGGECGGVAKDCGDPSLVDACMVGACAADTGDCVLVAVQDGLACDDADPCSAGESCATGACLGGSNLCGSCFGKAAGDDCDDDDACTAVSTCRQDGDILLCVGENKVDCTGLDTTCEVGRCLPQSGECVATPANEDGPCDDGDDCTENDMCNAGVCTPTTVVSATLDACGIAAPALCEPDDPIGEDLFVCDGDACVDRSVGVALLDTGAVMNPSEAFVSLRRGSIYARVDSPGDVDFFRVVPSSGTLLSAAVLPNCQGDNGVSLCVLDAAGQPLGDCVYGGFGDRAAVDRFSIGDDEAVYFKVSTLSGDAGGYILRVDEERQRGCLTDSECACEVLTCEIASGEQEGECVDTLPLEFEPNNAVSEATPIGDQAASLAAGTISFVGAFGADADYFAVYLEAGVPYEVGSASYCGTDVVSLITVLGPDGEQVVSSNAATPQAPISPVIPLSGVHFIKVEPFGQAANERYRLDVTDLRCMVDSDCRCSGYQRCSAADGVAGICVAAPEYSEVEPNGELAQSTPITLGAPSFGSIHFGPDVVLDEADWFSVELSAASYTIATEVYCQSTEVLDTVIAVYDESGALLVAGDDSDILSGVTLDLSVAQTVYIEVKASVYAQGDYMLRVSSD